MPPRRRRRLIRNGTGLAVIMTFAVVVAAIVIGYGRSGGPADTSAVAVAPPVVPPVEPLSDSPPAGASAPPATAAASSPATPPPSTVALQATRSTPVRAPTPAHSGAPTVPVFVPITIQAEASGNIRTGGAQAFACAPCAGGARVGYLAGANQLFIDVTVPVGGRRTLEVTYETDGPRTLDVSANGVRIAQPELTGVGWETPMAYQVVVTLPAGLVRLGFFNDAGPAPDIDLVVVR
jgi:hypothetical protein